MWVSIHVGEQGDRKGLLYISSLSQHVGETLAVSLPIGQFLRMKVHTNV